MRLAIEVEHGATCAAYRRSWPGFGDIAYWGVWRCVTAVSRRTKTTNAGWWTAAGATMVRAGVSLAHFRVLREWVAVLSPRYLKRSD